jgi:hypothetical protein
MTKRYAKEPQKESEMVLSMRRQSCGRVAVENKTATN